MNSVWLVFWFVASSWAVPRPAVQIESADRLSDQLSRLRGSILQLEKSLITGSTNRDHAKQKVRKLRKLIQLQREERQLSERRLQELEDYIAELESRREQISAKIDSQKSITRDFLKSMELSSRQIPYQFPLPIEERIQGPKRRAIRKLVDRGLKRLESLEIDLADADQLEGKIQDEKNHLAFLFQDLQEQESLLKFHKELQVEVLRQNYKDRLARLQRYREFKDAENTVETLIRQFDAHIEFEKMEETERTAAKSMLLGNFAQLQGKLRPPIDGRVISGYGKRFDAASELVVFQKGVRIEAASRQSVRAVASGRVAFSGKLPKYGNVTIVDHGAHYYSLCSGFGALGRKVGDYVERGDPLGVTDDKGTAIYFEIRAKNVAVNPLKWLAQ